MKILKNDSNNFHARLTGEEFDVLSNLLGHYPVIPPGYHLLSHGQKNEDDQQLLDESLMELQAENKKLIQEFLDSDEFFLRDKKGISMQIPPGQFEWFLQILNDIRVGLWIRQGCPDEEALNNFRQGTEMPPDAWNMELCGFIISMLLDHD